MEDEEVEEEALWRGRGGTEEWERTAEDEEDERGRVRFTGRGLRKDSRFRELMSWDEEAAEGRGSFRRDDDILRLSSRGVPRPEIVGS